MLQRKTMLGGCSRTAGVWHRLRRAMRWYRMAPCGDAFAQINMGRLYANGRVVAQDHDETCAGTARLQTGECPAQCSIGWLYENSRACRTTARRCAGTAAADQGSAQRRTMLGLYENGRGVAQDYGERCAGTARPPTRRCLRAEQSWIGLSEWLVRVADMTRRCWYRMAADQVCCSAKQYWVAVPERPGRGAGLWRGHELVPQGRRPGQCSCTEQYWSVVPERPRRGAGLRRGDALVSQGGGPRQCYSPNQYRVVVRDGSRRRAGLR
jgi:hypothetical protein